MDRRRIIQFMGHMSGYEVALDSVVYKAKLG